MSVFSVSRIDCPDVQIDFMTAWNQRQRVGSNLCLFPFLTSAVNRSNLQEIIMPNKGNVRTAEIVYSPRITENEVSTAITRDCTSSNTAGQFSTTCTVDKDVGATIDEIINWEGIATTCSTRRQVLAERLVAMVDAMDRKIETEITTAVVACAGNFADNDQEGVAGDDLKTVTTTTSGATDLDALEELRFSRNQSAFGGAGYVFGSNLISKYMARVAAGCCKDEGVDINQFFGESGLVFCDTHRVPTEMTVEAGGTEGFLMLDAGSAQFVYFNLYGGENTIDSGAWSAGNILSPRTGVEYDLTVKFDCNKEYLQMSLPFNVCCIPSDLYALNDRLSGVNGILKFKAQAA